MANAGYNACAVFQTREAFQSHNMSKHGTSSLKSEGPGKEVRRMLHHVGSFHNGLGYQIAIKRMVVFLLSR